MANTTKVLSYAGLEKYDELIKAYIAENSAPAPDLSSYLTAEDINESTVIGQIKIGADKSVQIKGLYDQNGTARVDGLIVNGDLTVKGTTTTENSTDSVIESAVIVINSEGVENNTTLMGQVILTGRRYAFFSGFYDELSTPSDYDDKGWDYTQVSEWRAPGRFVAFPFDGYSEDFVCTELHWVDDSILWYNDGATRLYGVFGDGVERILYDSSNGGWQNLEFYYEEYQQTISGTFQEGDFYIGSITDIVLEWLKQNTTFDEGNVYVQTEAYGILYDPSTEAIRLGRGYYNKDGNRIATFQFLQGEGEPIAVRDLGVEDDGALVMWDAEKYRLVSAPLKIEKDSENNSNKLLINFSNDDSNSNVVMEPGIMSIDLDNVNNEAKFSIHIDDQNDNGGWYASNSAMEVQADKIKLLVNNKMGYESSIEVTGASGIKLGGADGIDLVTNSGPMGDGSIRIDAEKGSDAKLQLGDTTITAAQLKALLALLDNNILAAADE